MATHIVDSVDYILSRIWADEEGRDTWRVAVLDELIYTSERLQKADARPGGYMPPAATGHHRRHRSARPAGAAVQTGARHTWRQR